MPASTSAWQFAHSRTHLRASSRQRSSDRATPRSPSANDLVAGIDVVELQRADVAVVSAQRSSPAGLIDQQLP